MQLQLDVWVFVLSLIGVLIVGGVAGFFLARYLIKKSLEKNPPVTEKQVRAMYEQGGRKLSEKQVRAIMHSINKNR
ncbi:MAG: YneF family protein [Bacilli bacterium]|nr:YneF family protein [Bacilli bacterium]